MKANIFATIILLYVLCTACSNADVSQRNIESATIPTAIIPVSGMQIRFEEIGKVGVFDASLAHGEGLRIWMSYSAVELPADGSRLTPINTRIAYSDDSGATWQDSGLLVNESHRVELPDDSQATEAIWLHEVSDLVYDPYAPTEARWILVWHQYLRAIPEGSQQQVNLYEHGWIAIRTAADPLGPWSEPKKLFTGRLYSGINDASGLPAFKLNELYSSADELGNCATFTEPAVYANSTRMYVTLKCPMSGDAGKIILLGCSHDFSDCEYLGDFLDDSEAARFGPAYNGFSAPELVEVNGKVYLLATPTETDAKIYRGCLVFRVADLDAGTLEAENGTSTVVTRIEGQSGTFSGACSYNAASTESGIIYNQAELDDQIEYQLYESGVILK